MEVAAIISSLASLIASVAVLLSVFRTGGRITTNSQDLKDKIDIVHDEVKTGNAQTLGTLANAIETRRIEVIPPENRTVEEQEHLDST